METGNGWIKLHRSILDNPITQKPNHFSLWINLLLLANHKEKKIMWNGKVIIIKSGQLITGRKQLSAKTGIPESTVERILKYLENEHQIEQQKTTKFRLVTIVNWDEYQKADSTLDNKRTTNGQQTDTNKNDNNVKNEKKDTSEPIDSRDKEIAYIIELFKEISPSLSYGNKTQRKACKEMLEKWPMEKLEPMILKVLSVQGKKFAPRATTPHAMWTKIGDIASYFKEGGGVINNVVEV